MIEARLTAMDHFNRRGYPKHKAETLVQSLPASVFKTLDELNAEHRGKVSNAIDQGLNDAKVGIDEPGEE